MKSPFKSSLKCTNKLDQLCNNIFLNKEEHIAMKINDKVRFTLIIYLSFFSIMFLASVSCGASKVIYEVDPVEHPVVINQVAGPNITFIVLGDQGTGNGLQREVARGMKKVMDQYGTDFVIGTGDNFYGKRFGSPDGVLNIHDPKWDSTFVNVYHKIYESESFDKFYMTLGNHDYSGIPEVQVSYGIINKSWYMPSRYYKFNKQVSNSETNAVSEAAVSVDFFALDTNPFIYPKYYNESEVGKQIEWLEKSLKESKAQWKIVYGHHPPRSNSCGHTDAICEINEKNPDNIAKWIDLLDKIENNNVQIGFFGHDHDVQALKQVNGVHYFVSGGGGKHRDVRWDEEDTRYALTNGGFIWCRVTPEEFLVVIFDKGGNPKWESTIQHSELENTKTKNYWRELLDDKKKLIEYCKELECP